MQNCVSSHHLVFILAILISNSAFAMVYSCTCIPLYIYRFPCASQPDKPNQLKKKGKLKPASYHTQRQHAPQNSCDQNLVVSSSCNKLVLVTGPFSMEHMLVSCYLHAAPYTCMSNRCFHDHMLASSAISFQSSLSSSIEVPDVKPLDWHAVNWCSFW